MEARRFVASLVSTGLAYSDFRREMETHANPRQPAEIFTMDEATEVDWAKRKVKPAKPVPPKRRGENREQYRQRLKKAGVL